MPELDVTQAHEQIMGLLNKTADEVKSVRESQGEIKAVATDLKEIRRELEAVKAAGKDSPELKSELDKAHKRMDGLEAQLGRPGVQSPTDLNPGNIGEEFLGSDELKEWRSRGWHRGGVAFKTPKSFFSGGQKAVISTSTISPDPVYIPGIQAPLVRDLRIRDLMRVVPIDRDSIKYTRELSFTNNASPQVEASEKSESTFTFEDVTAEVKTLAHWADITRQAADDNPGLMNYINGRMTYGLKLEEEEQILAGDGTGENLEGLITLATAYDTGYSASGDTQIDMILNGMTQLRMADAPVDGTVLNPRDWAKIQKQKTEEGGANKGSYVYGNPGASPFQIATLWGRPVVITKAIAAGKFLVGAFNMFAEIRDRQEATVDISSENKDNFTKNKLTIRVEERIALLVTRTEAFVYGNL